MGVYLVRTLYDSNTTINIVEMYCDDCLFYSSCDLYNFRLVNLKTPENGAKNFKKKHGRVMQEQRHWKSRFQGIRLIKQNQMIPPVKPMRIVVLLFAQPVVGG